MAGFRMHFIVSHPKGPIVSGGGRHSPEVAALIGQFVGKPGNYAIACDPKLKLSATDRATDRPYAVECPACRATEIFKRLWEPHPSLADSDAANVFEAAAGQAGQPADRPADAKPGIPESSPDVGPGGPEGRVATPSTT